ncbi:NERD domain-containing protein [Geminocystis sp. NIES-3709]|uniref:NERD domain-containing protein n=1 Tax=Geminocystis sp. NIES-3709 TaxID=1617448 RepID=UPI0005FC8334|nr:NERD domain-containing protein [Geminocystis sp. NIES-3709]BAQ64679.1 phospholipid-lipopolysaccharide ABC transporter [Geminocystis sp. NIES-3709]
MTTTSEEVWQLLKELIEAQKETDRRFQQTERLLKENAQETDHRFQEIKDSFAETNQRFQETDRRFRETERLLKEQSKKTDEQIGKLGNRLGEFVEWQVRPAVVRLFQERGIDVHEFFPDVSVKRATGGLQIDLLVVNETEAILVEVKSKLSQTDVDEHLERLGKFKELMPRYGDVNALGAVAGMIVPDDIGSYAYRKGLYVLAQSGENVVILNDKKFKPRVW